MATHTAGPWEIQTPLGESCPWIVPVGQHAYEWEPIATLGDCTEDSFPSRSKQQRQIDANARLIAAAPDLLYLAYIYRDDLRHPPSADSITRRLAAIDAAIAKATA